MSKDLSGYLFLLRPEEKRENKMALIASAIRLAGGELVADVNNIGKCEEQVEQAWEAGRTVVYVDVPEIGSEVFPNKHAVIILQYYKLPADEWQRETNDKADHVVTNTSHIRRYVKIIKDEDLMAAVLTFIERLPDLKTA